MLDKIRGKKKDDKDAPDLRGNNKKKNDSDIGGRLKGMVGKVTGKSDNPPKEAKKNPPERKMPKPMPKPMAKPGETPRLRPPQRKSDSKRPIRSGGSGVRGGFGRKIQDDDQKTLIGLVVVAFIIIVLGGALYYFFIQAPYTEAFNAAKQAKINEVNTYFTGPLTTDPRGIDLRIQIDSAQTPFQVDAIDVMVPATQAWREYQSGQITNQTDPYGRVMFVYAAGGQKNVVLKAADAQAVVNTQLDAKSLVDITVKKPDTVAIPIIVSRLQAAGGLVNVGNSVDVYLMNATSNTTVANNTTNTPNISGATVLAILRAKDSGVIVANKSHAQDMAINNLVQMSSRSESATQDVEQLIRAVSARNWDENEVSTYLNSYGWRLSDFERTSNLGELDAQYLLLLEVPRENAIFLIQNMNNVILTVPTQQAPNWMVKELKAIYG
ncbi:MAG: DUF515 domain-containing protein [Methanobacterium sp.]|uniref:DUF515 domain-containing protein n=1 Tax=Methanobacterium sp. TaxID=2164 RepID=UPI003D655970|nr:DUF515 domain-containing protein [Methanobacterium sp.]